MVGGAQAGKYRAEEVRCRHQHQDQCGDLQGLDQGVLESLPGQLPVCRGEEERTEGAHARGLRGRGETQQYAAEREAHQRRRRHQSEGEFLEHLGHRLRTHVLRQRGAEIRVDLAADQGVAGIEEGQHEAGDDGSGEQVRHRHFQDRPHDHQHDARRNQDAPGFRPR